MAIRVYYEDTDAGGVVYHARYLAFAERARTEALRALGVPHAELVELHDLVFMVRRVEMDYDAPARLDEELRVETDVRRVGAASVRLHQAFSVAGRRVGVLRVELACVRRVDGRPARMPARWRRVLAAQVGVGPDG